jgi:predicted O-methyltransferase YrrM
LGNASADRVRRVRERVFELRPELFPVAIGLDEGLALREWVVREQARTTLEAGLGWAVATLFILEGLVRTGSEVRHVAADPWQHQGLEMHRTRYEGAGLRLLEEAGVRDLVEFYEEESQIVFPRLLGEQRRFDLVFIDANHRFEGVFVDLFYAGRLLREGGVVFLDDVQLPGVRRAIEFYLANLGWELEDEGHEGDEHGWAVVRTRSHDAFLRPFAEFVDF